jgi:hypothetical protein
MQYVGYVSLGSDHPGTEVAEITSLDFHNGLLCIGTSDTGAGPLVCLYRVNLRPLFNPRNPKQCDGSPLMSLRMFGHSVAQVGQQSRSPQTHVCTAKVLPALKVVAAFRSNSKNALLLDWNLGNGK